MLSRPADTDHAVNFQGERLGYRAGSIALRMTKVIVLKAPQVTVMCCTLRKTYANKSKRKSVNPVEIKTVFVYVTSCSASIGASSVMYKESVL